MVAQLPQRALTALTTYPQEVRLEIERRRLERDMYAFMQDGWHVLERKRFCPGWHIEALCEHLMAVLRGEIEYLVVNMPPRHCKTLSVSVFWPAFGWASMPWKRWLFASYAQGLSSEAARKFRKLVTSPWYQARWGHRFALTSDQNTKLEIVNDQNGHRIATAAKAQGTGKGGDIVVADDPNKVGHAESKAELAKTITWWREEMGTREDTGDEEDSPVARVIVQQRVHHQDLTGDALAEGADAILDFNVAPPVHLCFPAEFEGNKTPNAFGFVDPREEEGELLWPEGCSAKRLAKIKAALKTPHARAGQLQQRPVPKDGGMVKKSWLRRFSTPPADYDYKFIVGDFSGGSTKKKGSANAFGVFLVKGQDLYLVDVEHFRGIYATARSRLIALCKRHPDARAKVVEDTVNGRSFIQDDTHGVRGVIKYPAPSQDKEVRLDPCTTLIQAGYYHVPVDGFAGWVEDYVFQLTNFPYADGDDLVDMTSMAIEHVQKPKPKLVVGGRILD